MKIKQLFLLVLIIALFLIFQMAIVNPVIAHQLPSSADESVYFQITPTETPMIQNGIEALTTNQILLQIIILLGILTVLVIISGVWISRRQVDLQ
jgi:hypothetical protein